MSSSVISPLVLSSAWPEYELIDSGNRQKLERFGRVTIVRSEPKAWWNPDRPALWDKADAVLLESGRWKMRKGAPRTWVMELAGVKLQARLTDGSKHLGIFPEQEPHWKWMMNRIKAAAKGAKSGSPVRVLNLFGYTGVATLAAARAGAQVTHVDASKPSIAWGRDNQAVSGMNDAPVRWILEDAMKYVGRELKRGSCYEGILLDPPSFGRGPKGEVWKVEEKAVELLTECRKLLSDNPSFMILTMYNLEASSLMLRNLMGQALGSRGGEIEVGELALPHAHSDKLLPLSIFGRWSA